MLDDTIRKTNMIISSLMRQSLIYLLGLLGLICLSNGRLIHFKNNTEYIFKLESNARVKSSDSIQVRGKFGLSRVCTDEFKWQDIYLSVYNLHVDSGDYRALLNDEDDLTRWFSFKIGYNGELIHVQYPPDETDDILSIKKGIVNLLCGQYLTQEDVKEDAGSNHDADMWEYHVNESSHEGQHLATYTATSTEKGILFTKHRHSHPIKHGKFHHKKEIHYDSSLKLPKRITVDEGYSAPQRAVDGYNPTEGMRLQEPNEEDDGFTLPEMSITSEAKLEFEREHILENCIPFPQEELISDVLLYQTTIRKKDEYNDTSFWEHVRTNLTCLRKDDALGAVGGPGMECFKKLVDVLKCGTDDQLTDVIHHFFVGNLSRRLRDSKDRVNILDALGSLRNYNVQVQLTNAILRSPNPSTELAKRLLIHAIGSADRPSQRFLDTLVDMIFHSDLFPIQLKDKDLQRTAVMVLGAVASTLRETGHQPAANQIVQQIEDALGIHDPWQYQRSIESVPKKYHGAIHLNVVAKLEALGNAGMERSFEHIHSYINCSDTPHIIKRAALNALRDFHDDRAAEVLVSTVLNDANDHVRYTAIQLLKAHPYGNQQNDTLRPPNATTVYDGEHGENIHDSYEAHKHRSKRGFWEGFEFILRLPSYEWSKQFGGSAIGASIGLSLVNQFELKISPLEGRLNIEARDEAYARAHVGLVNKNFDIAIARFCWHGHMGYKINVLKEFRSGLKDGLTNLFDKYIRQPMDNIKRAVDLFRDIMSGIKNLPQAVDDFIDALDTIPDQLLNIRNIAFEAATRLAVIDTSALPPFVQRARATIMKTVQLFHDVKTDIMELYHAISDEIKVALPWAIEQIKKSALSISERIPDLFKSPLPTLDEIFKGIFNNKIAVDAVLKIKKRIKETKLFKDGLKSYWDTLKGRLKEQGREILKLKDTLIEDLRKWLQDTISQKEDEIRQFVRDELMAITDLLYTPINSLKMLLSPFLELASDIFKFIETVKTSFQSLRKSVQEARTFITGLFGPKVHPKFPREYRLHGGGCSSDGFYPTTTDGNYEDQGVDVLVSSGGTVVAPFSGTVSKPPGSNRIQLIPTGGMIRNTIIFIDNIIANPEIPTGEGISVIGGSPIGKVASNGPCGTNTHIHFVVKSYQSDRNMVLTGELGEPTQSEPTVMGVIDPSGYLQDRPIELQEWIQECDDYKVQLLNKVYAAGSLRDGSSIEMVDLSLPRIEIPPISEWKIDENLLSKIKLPKLPEWGKIGNAVDSLIDDLGLPKLGLGKIFNFDFKIGNMNISSIFSFFEKLGQGDLNIKDLLNDIANKIAIRPCVDVDALTDEELSYALMERGESASGSRSQLEKRYLQPEDRCPLLQLSLPLNTYCQIDPTCLGVECCVSVSIAVFKKSISAFVRFDPCMLQLVMGIEKWTKTIQIADPEWVIEDDVALPLKFKIPILGRYEARARYKFEKTTTLIIASLSVGFCDTSQPGKCLKSIDILRESAFPIPTCSEDATMFWENFDLQDYFDREDLLDQLKDTGQDFLEEIRDAAVNKLFEELGLPSFLLDDSVPCVRPEKLTNAQLITALAKRDLSETGTRQDRETRLAMAERTCRYFTLPPFQEAVARHVYCSVRDDCFRIDCCLDIEFGDTFSKSFRAFIELDPCNVTIAVGFESLIFKRILFNLPEGIENEERIGGITLKYSIAKNTAGDSYVVDFSAAICFSSDNCPVNVDIVEDYVVPIPLCNNNFSLSLPGGFSLQNFIEDVGSSVAQEAIDVLLQYLGLQDKLSNEACDHAAIMNLRGDCPSVEDPALGSSVTCAIEDRCLGVQCCMDIDLEITQLSVQAWIRLEPCDFIVTVGFGEWSFNITLFKYHWNTPQKKRIGRVITVSYTVDKLDDEKQFQIDLEFLVCLNGDELCVPITILSGEKFAIPLCNENFTLPDGDSVTEFLQNIGDNIGDSVPEAILRYLGLAQYIDVSMCQKPQLVVNGWETACTALSTNNLPHLPEQLSCRRFEDCLGIECCVELDLIATTISSRFSFYFDLCDYVLAFSIGEWKRNISLFNIDWDIRESLTIGKAIRIEFNVKRDDQLQIFRLDLNLQFCVDDNCIDFDILQDTVLPIPFCHPNATLTLPGDGSIRGFVSQIGSRIKEEAVDAVLRSLKIKEFVSDECETAELAPLENVCPSLNLPVASSHLSCTRLGEGCAGARCCMELDILITRIHLDAWILLDICQLSFSMGLGSWSYEWSFASTDIDIQDEIEVSSYLKLRYSIRKLPNEPAFDVDLTAVICIDGICSDIDILIGTQIQNPLCDGDIISGLPGDGSVEGFLQQLGGQVTDAAKQQVLEHLGIQKYFPDDGCSIDGSSTAACGGVTISQGDSLHCRVMEECFGIECCLDLDIIITTVAINTWFVFDPCGLTLSVGFGKWSYSMSLLTYDWGIEKSFNIGAVIVRFNVKRQDDSDQFELNVGLTLDVDGDVIDYPLLDELAIPIPGCHGNALLPGDSTISTLLQQLGGNIGSIGVDVVLRILNLQDIVKQDECPVTVTNNDECPSVSLPSLPDNLHCFIEQSCLAIHCCAAMDFRVTELMVETSIALDPCQYKLTINFGTWEKEIELLDNIWGNMKTVEIGEFVTIMYLLDQIDEDNVITIDLIVKLCFDGKCKEKQVLKNKRVPKPLCMMSDPSRRKRQVKYNDEDEKDQEADGVLDLLGITSDIQLQRSCLASSDLHLTAAGCQWSSTLNHYCSFGKACQSVRCCLPVKYNKDSRSFTIFVNIEQSQISLQFEKWFYNETITPKLDSSIEQDIDIGNIRFRLKMIRPHRKLLVITLALMLCPDKGCRDEVVLLDQTPFVTTAIPNTLIRSPGGRIRRQTNTENEIHEVTQSIKEKAQAFFKALLASGVTTITPQENMETSLLGSQTKGDQSGGITGQPSRRLQGLVSIEQNQEALTQTRQSGTSGADVVESAVEQVGRVFSSGKTFLRRIAWVESKYGTHPNTYRSRYHGGIWQVDRIGFLDTQDVNSHPSLSRKFEQINNQLNIDWQKVSWQDLRKPLYSALAARLFLTNIPGSIPNDVNGQARYWKEHYNTGAGAGSEDKFINDVNALEGQVSGSLQLRRDSTVSEFWAGLGVVGGGLTDKGVTVLTKKLSGKTLGELESILDTKHLEPAEASKLLGEMHEMYKSATQGAIDTLTQKAQEEEFGLTDSRLDGEKDIPKIKKTFWEYETPPIPIAGILTLTFEFGIGGYISFDIPFKNRMVTMEASQGVAPGAGLLAWAGVNAKIYIFQVSLILEGKILDTTFPFKCEIGFGKFPLDLKTRLDIEMVPLSIRLFIEISVKVKILFVKIDKTLFKKDLWKYSTPAITGNIWNKIDDEKDTSPPEIMEFSVAESSRSKRQAINPGTSRHCSVEQIPGLDYTDPAFDLRVVALDDKSKVLYKYYVGCQPGGKEVVDTESFGGPSATISRKIQQEVCLKRPVLCRLTTPCVIHEDSVIISWREGVGSGTGVWGDNVLPWIDVDNVRVNPSTPNGNVLENFTGTKLGRLVTESIVMSDTRETIGDCARDCLDLPASKCLSFNYDHATGGGTCELLEEIEGHGVDIHESGFFYHYERLGIGHAVEFHHANVPLTHNNVYYFNIYVMNFVGYENVISSKGILTDFTTPYPGCISNSSIDVTVNEPCIHFVSDEWQYRCIQDTTLPNHSAVTATQSSSQRYYVSCGAFGWSPGWSRCTRRRTIYSTVCAAGWTGSISSGCPTPICPGACNNQGQCVAPYVCTCNLGYYPVHCAACTGIVDCDQESCSTASDQICLLCNGQYEVLGNAYYPSANARICVKQCSWRSNDACWPGSCTDQGVCTCSNGYNSQTGTIRDCTTINEFPTLSFHMAKLHYGSSTIESPSTLGTPTSYTNVRIADVDSYNVSMTSLYQPTHLPSPSSYPYVHSASIGIINVKATYSLKGQSLIINCPSSGSQDSPRTDIVDCNDMSGARTFSSLSIASGDRLECKFEVTNGGYLKLFDRDSTTQLDIITQYYSGSTKVMTETFTFDYDDPKHCDGGGAGSCDTGPSMLTVGEDVTTEPNVRIQWVDWIDTLAGIYQYHLEIRKMGLGSHDNQLTELYSEEAVYNGYTQSGEDVTLPTPGVFSVVLIPKDRAGNIQVARRFVLFDNVTQGPIINANSRMIVTSASADTQNMWITTHDESTSVIGLDWTHHFINEAHHVGGFLREIGNHRDYSIANDYDDEFGRRNLEEIPNADGVTEFRVHFELDHKGGSTIDSPSVVDTRTWENMTSQTTGNFPLPVTDGDSVRFWVYAEDRLRHGIIDAVLVHVDSSPAEIDYLWLARDGEVNLAVHSTSQLQEMRIQFRTYDVHSGLESLIWRISDYDSSETLQEGARPVIRNPEECNAETCICTPDGNCHKTDYEFSLPEFHLTNHDFDFLISVTVTNNAKLETTRTLKVTVDVSPPVAGVVHDGLQGSNELDFQANMELNANWDGFFDKESGVMFYRYAFDSRCWNKEEFKNSNVANTSSTTAYWEAASAGTYYVTVVAYNRALEPSLPVCSDGVTIDATQPLISEVEIRNARIKPGFAKDGDGVVWYIESDRTRRTVVNIPDICSATFAEAPDIMIYPTSRKPSRDLAYVDENCEGISNTGDMFYLAVEQHISINWNGIDNESSIFNYNIGLGSDPNSSVPDIVPYASTAGRSEYVIHHPNVAQGSMFYVVLEAVNKAQMAITKTIGPIIIDTTAPTFDGNLDFNLTLTSLEVRWDRGAFSDDVDDLLTFELAIGHGPYGTDTMAFQNADNFPATSCLQDYICATILLDQLQWALHTDHVFYVTIKASNTVGFFITETSTAIRHFQQLPSVGVVYDVAPSTIDEHITFGESPDFDVQLSNTKIAARWSGFAHPHLDIQYDFGVGTSPGLTDVTAGYIDVGVNTHHEEENLLLENLQTYYVSIRVTAITGSVEVTSDGITVLDSAIDIVGAVVNDGIPCEREDIPPNIIELGGVPCTTSDLQFQAATSVAESHWIIPQNIQSIVTNVYWSLEEGIFDQEQQMFDWTKVIDHKNIGYATYHIEEGLYLTNGAMYRATVELCHVDVCFEPISSDGFLVFSTPPTTGTIDVDVLPESATEGAISDVDIYFQPFQQTMKPIGLDTIDIIDRYEWTVSDDVNDQAILMGWTTIDNLEDIGDMMRFRATLETTYDYTRCIFVNVRGYNKAGLSASVQKELVNCDPSEDIVNPKIVVDASGQINLEKNAPWLKPDVQYSANASTLFAVWPTLRHGSYDWAVIEESADEEFLVQLASGLHAVCDHQMTIACGRSEKEFVNIYDLTLEHGKRYHICIHANSTSQIFEEWEKILPEVSSCSDGVVIDITPPNPGSVWIGWDSHIQYQRSTSDIVIHWDHFTDVEEHGQSSHTYGVKNYEYAIGSYPGGSDIHNFTDLGIADHVIVTGLYLESGHVYHASVRATDFVGLSSTSVSEAVLVDNTLPVIINGKLGGVGKAVWTSTTIVRVNWAGAFLDSESGVAFYDWSVGSQPGHADVIPFTRTESDQETSIPNSPLTLRDGHTYFVTIKATNGAGLSDRCIIGPYLVDASPPIAGRVYDGDTALRTPDKKDQDFQTDLAVLHASWEGFHDPHSSIIVYKWAIGLCSGCDDVFAQQSIGISKDASADHLHLVPGFRYYVTVTACNVADLCTSVTSDGIILDDSPPSVGRVYDGTHGGDIQFSSSRYHLAAHWWGYHDVHSGILYYQWRAGTSPGADNIIQADNVHLQRIAFRFLTDPLPLNVIIYVTVRAYNKAGLWNEATSDGFIIDGSSPEVISPVSRVDEVGVVVSDTQVLPDVIRFTWLFDDQESTIRRQYVSLSTHHNGDVNIEPFEINPSDTNYTFTSLDLHDGALYTLHVTACNGAKRCTTSSSSEFLVDSTLSTTGSYAIDTDHAANLMRQRPNTMVWRTDSNNSISYVDLAWLGFADCHSGIDHYLVKVGYSYDTHELTEAEIPTIQHSDSVEDIDEGIVQTHSVTLNYIAEVGQRLYISIWAVNGVGLKSRRVHSAFELASSGILTEGPLVLVRRCESHSCEGHCICAPGEQLCMDGNINLCDDVTENNPNDEIEIYDILDIQESTISSLEDYDDVDFIPTQLVLSAKWKVTTTKVLPIVRYEWSIGRGLTAQREPEGVFHPANEIVWHDIAQDTSVVVPLQDDKKLIAGVQYYFFVRAWYNDNTFAVFQSDGVMPYVMPLKPVVILGASVKDFQDSTSGSEDVDFTTDNSMITIDWFQVFASDPGALSFFEVALGTFPGGEDIETFVDHYVNPDQHKVTLSNLNLQNGVVYFGNVRAFTKTGLHTTSSSDGFRVDVTPPSEGNVRDGVGLHELEYQNTTTEVAASWHGFNDLESYIDSYEWCVGDTMDADEANVMSCINVGLHLSASREISPGLVAGTRYFSKVFATDASGLRSAGAVSNGFVPDITPPIPQCTGYGTNIITNPSFESVIDEPLDTFTNITDEDVTKARPVGWDISDGSQCAVVASMNLAADDGDSVIAVYGELSQMFVTSVGKKYEVSLSVSHIPYIRNTLNQEGRIEAPGVKRVFVLYDKPATDHDDVMNTKWQRHVFHFTADSADSKLVVASLGEANGFLLDSVQVREIEYEEAVTTNPVNVFVQFIHGWSSVQAIWCFVDDESPIMEYRWAIGHVAGGTQLQNFVIVGKESTAQNTNLKLKHGESIYVTVAATNEADLTAVAFAEEVVVDLTAPVVTDVFDGEFKDLDFQTSLVLTASWKASDDQSGIAFCEWAVGFEPGSSGVIDRTAHPQPPYTFTTNLSEDMIEGSNVYTTVWCTNGVGLSTKMTSNGITIVTQAPETASASVHIHSESSTGYILRDSFQSDSNVIRLSWQGFQDEVGISSYECQLMGPSIELSEWRKCGTEAENTADLIDLSLTSEAAYMINVRAVNFAGLVSDHISRNVSVQTSMPLLSGQGIVTQWGSNGTLTISWIDVFVSPSQLVYEISLGTRLGASNVLLWTETMDTEMLVSPLLRFTDYYLILTAINGAGLFKTLNDVIVG